MSEKVLVLISDGIDSIVAADILIRKGFDVEFIHHSATAHEYEEIIINKVKELVRVLARRHKKEFLLHITDYKIFHERTRNTKNYRIHCILCKRTMLRTAEKLADERGIRFLGNGDNVGQVASQTLKNLEIIRRGVNKAILSPLLFMDKQDIINIGRRIGTYELSIKNQLKCPYVPKNPATKVKAEQVISEEEKLKIDEVIQDIVKSARTERVTY